MVPVMQRRPPHSILLIDTRALETTRQMWRTTAEVVIGGGRNGLVREVPVHSLSHLDLGRRSYSLRRRLGSSHTHFRVRRAGPF